MWAIPMAQCKKNQQILHSKLDNLEVFNNDKSLGVLSEKAMTHHYCQAKIKFCMHVVDIRHQECLVSIVIVWPTCSL